MKIIADIRFSAKEYPITKEGSAPLLDLALPDNVTPDTPLVIWFHGGGIDHGTKDGAARKIIEALAEYGIAAASCNYRLYPDGKYPEFIEDCARAVDFLLNKSDYKFTDIFAGGSSAGVSASVSASPSAVSVIIPSAAGSAPLSAANALMLTPLNKDTSIVRTSIKLSSFRIFTRITSFL